MLYGRGYRVGRELQEDGRPLGQGRAQRPHPGLRGCPRVSPAMDSLKNKVLALQTQVIQARPHKNIKQVD